MLNHFESTEYLQATIDVYTQEYPITLPVVGIGQMSWLNAHCSPILEIHVVNLFSTPAERFRAGGILFWRCRSVLPLSICLACYGLRKVDQRHIVKSLAASYH